MHPHLVRLPEDLDLGKDGAELFLRLVLVETAGAQILGQQEDAAKGLQDGAALGLGGMGREDRQIDQLGEQALKTLGADPRGLELAHRMIEGAQPEGAALADLTHAVPVAMHLLGGADQTEINGEGADDLGQGLGIQTLDPLHQLVELIRVRPFPQTGEALTQALHHHQHPLGAVLPQDLAQEGGEEIDIAPELVVGGVLCHG
mgnify:CR=1 FL=1